MRPGQDCRNFPSVPRISETMNKTSRRQFLKVTGAAAGAAFAARNLRAWPATQQVSLAMVPPLSVFNYSQVELLDSLFRQQFDNNHNLYLHLNEDALLKPFRHRMGMPAPGPDMGGWYDDADDFSTPDNFHAFIPGHSFGQYLSGLARAYAVTGHKPTQEKVHRLVRGFAQTVDKEGKFYVDYRLPPYAYDKTSCGLIDAHEFAADPDALDVQWRATESAMPHLPEKALSRAAQRARPHKEVAYTWDETYTLPENLFLAYQRSGNSRYRDLAVRFIEGDYFDRSRKGRTCFPVSMLTATSMPSTPQCRPTWCWVTKNICARQRMASAWCRNRVTLPEAGDLTKPSSFPKPAVQLHLNTTHASFETPCGVYGHFKSRAISCA